jgi:hypothetical protein
MQNMAHLCHARLLLELGVQVLVTRLESGADSEAHANRGISVEQRKEQDAIENDDR